MKRFSVPCDFGGKRSPFHVYIGDPNPKNHPLHFQADWLSKERGGSIPPEVMDSFDKLHKIAIEQGVSFEELCVYALGAAAEENKKNPKKQEEKKKQQNPQMAQMAAMLQKKMGEQTS